MKKNLHMFSCIQIYENRNAEVSQKNRYKNEKIIR